ncbi:MAG TPA: hypothetical protein VFY14_03965 [Streptomyces sp.]|nr:hypothetical protein [Streptomyces sp.]
MSEHTAIPPKPTHPPTIPAQGRLVRVTGRTGRLPDWRHGPVPLESLSTPAPTDQDEDETRDTETGHDSETPGQDTGTQDSETRQDTHPDETPETGDTDETPGERDTEAGQDTAPSFRTVPLSQLRRHLQHTVLTNSAAAAAGAWGYGAFTGQWDTGLPQTVLGWMHDAASTSTSPYTPLVLGGLTTGAAVVIGGGVYGRIARFTAHSRALCLALHWCLVRVPTASSIAAVALYATN